MVRFLALENRCLGSQAASLVTCDRTSVIRSAKRIVARQNGSAGHGHVSLRTADPRGRLSSSTGVSGLLLRVTAITGRAAIAHGEATRRAFQIGSLVMIALTFWSVVGQKHKKARPSMSGQEWGTLKMIINSTTHGSRSWPQSCVTAVIATIVTSETINIGKRVCPKIVRMSDVSTTPHTGRGLITALNYVSIQPGSVVLDK